MKKKSKAAEDLELIFDAGGCGIVADRLNFSNRANGITTDKNGLVKKVDEQGKAYDLGVRVGMRLLTVEGKPFTKDRYNAASAGQDNYGVTFAQLTFAQEHTTKLHGLHEKS